MKVIGFMAAPYTEKTDIIVTCFTTAGSADALTYYVEYVLLDTTEIN